MKSSKDRKILALTAVVSATALFVAVSKNLNAGQGYYGGYKHQGYDTGYQQPVPPGYQYYTPGMPPRMQGYREPYGNYPASQPSTNMTAPATTASNSVAISGMQFQPATIRVKAGEKITWINNATMPHTVTSPNYGLLASQRLNRGSVFSHTFEQPGTYTYYCALHPSMTGRVIVE
jgi:plastocyanin